MANSIRPDSNSTRHILNRCLIQVLFLFVLLIQASPGFAQKSLELRNNSGMTVGWLLNKISDSNLTTYLTPDGYLLSIYDNGNTSNSTQTAPTELMFESEDCTGDAWIKSSETSSRLDGEIFQVGDSMDSLHARMPRSGPSLGRTINSEKSGDGDCLTILVPGDQTVIQVEEVDPLAYGITESISGVWRVNGHNFVVVNNSEVISCDSFESCPAPD